MPRRNSIPTGRYFCRRYWTLLSSPVCCWWLSMMCATIGTNWILFMMWPKCYKSIVLISIPSPTNTKRNSICSKTSSVGWTNISSIFYFCSCLSLFSFWPLASAVSAAIRPKSIPWIATFPTLTTEKFLLDLISLLPFSKLKL